MLSWHFEYIVILFNLGILGQEGGDGAADGGHGDGVDDNNHKAVHGQSASVPRAGDHPLDMSPPSQVSS